MKLKMTIRTRMMVSILLTALVSFTISVFVCARKSQQLISERTKIIVELQSNDNAKNVSETFQNAISELDSLAISCTRLCDQEDENRDYLIENMLKHATKNSILLSPKVDWYVSESELQTISEPFIDKLPDKNESAYMCRIQAPILYDGEYAGGISANIIVDTMLRKFNAPFGFDSKMKILIITNKSTIAYSRNNAERLKKMGEVMPNYNKKYNLGSFISKDSLTILETDGQDVEKSIFTFFPIKINDKTIWSICVVSPNR